MDKETPPPVIPAKAGIQKPPGVRIETVAGGETTLIAAGSVRALRDALERGELDHTPLARLRP